MLVLETSSNHVRARPPQTRASHKGVRSVTQKSPRRVSRTSVAQMRPTRVLQKCRVKQDFPTRMSDKSAEQECRSTVLHESVLEDLRGVPKMSGARVSEKSAAKECPTRVSHKRVK